MECKFSTSHSESLWISPPPRENKIVLNSSFFTMAFFTMAFFTMAFSETHHFRHFQVTQIETFIFRFFVWKILLDFLGFNKYYIPQIFCYMLVLWSFEYITLHTFNFYYIFTLLHYIYHFHNNRANYFENFEAHCYNFKRAVLLTLYGQWKLCFIIVYRSYWYSNLDGGNTLFHRIKCQWVW